MAYAIPHTTRHKRTWRLMTRERKGAAAIRQVSAAKGRVGGWPLATSHCMSLAVDSRRDLRALALLLQPQRTGHRHLRIRYVWLSAATASAWIESQSLRSSTSRTPPRSLSRAACGAGRVSGASQSTVAKRLGVVQTSLRSSAEVPSARTVSAAKIAILCPTKGRASERAR